MGQWSTASADVNELHSQRREQFDSRGALSVSTLLMCPWESRYDLLWDLYTCQKGLGYLPRAFPENLGSSGSYFLTIGFSHASIETRAECYEVEDTQLKEMMKYKHAFIRVEYNRRYSVEDSIEFDTEYLTQNPIQFRWKSPLNDKDSRVLREAEAPGRLIHSAILTRNFKGVSPSEIARIPQLVGHTNRTAYTSPQLFFTFPEKTLLMLDPIVKPSTNLIGPAFSAGVDVTLKFLYKRDYKAEADLQDGDTSEPLGAHNTFWRPRGVKGTGTPGFGTGFWDTMEVADEVKGEMEWQSFEPFPIFSENVREGIDQWLCRKPQRLPIVAKADASWTDQELCV